MKSNLYKDECRQNRTFNFMCPPGRERGEAGGGGSAEPHPARLHCQVLCINHTLCPHIPAPILPSKKRLRIKSARNEGAANSRVNVTNFCQGRKQIKDKELSFFFSKLEKVK